MRAKNIFSFILLGIPALLIMAGCSGSKTTTVVQGSSPVIQSLSVQGLPSAPGGSITATVTVNSAQGLALTYTWTTSAGWSVITGGNTSTAVINAPDTYATSGTVTVEVSDSYGRDAFNTFPVSTIGNSVPVIAGMTALPNPVAPGGMITATVSATDRDGDGLSYTWSVPFGWQIASGQGTSNINITAPTSYSAGGNLTVTVSDGHGNSVYSALSIATDALSPVINALTVSPNPLNPTLGPGGTVTTALATVTATDPQGNTLTYSWSITSTTAGWNVTGYGTTATVVSPLISNSTATIVVRADNGKGGSALSMTGISTGMMESSYWGFNGPAGIAIDKVGNVWVTNYLGNTISELTYPTYTTSNTYIGLNGPETIAIDKAGNIWVTNFQGYTVSELTYSSGYTSSNTYYGFNGPHGIMIDKTGNVWVTNYQAHTVIELIYPTYTSSNTYSGFGNPYDIAIDAFGNVWVTDFGSNGLREFIYSSGYTSWNSWTGSWLNGPTGIAIDAFDNVWVANSGSNTISERLYASGYTAGKTFSVGSYPTGIAIDAASNIWVTNSGNGAGTTISELTYASGYSSSNTYAGFSDPRGIALDPAGNLWVTNSVGNTVSGFFGITEGPQYFPCSYFTDTSCPQFQGGGNW